MEFKTKYNEWDWVYLRHDQEQLRRMVVDFQIDKSGIQYLLRCGAEESYHYEQELRKTKDQTMALIQKEDGEE